MNKYHAKKTEVDGVTFDSKREAARYSDLKLMQRAGAIRNLELQVKFPLIVNELKVATYRCDFKYEENGRVVIEDSKGVRTRDYLIKRRLMRAIHGIEIRET